MSLHPRVVVCLDVKDGRVVKGTRFVGLRDVGDPVDVTGVSAEGETLSFERDWLIASAAFAGTKPTRACALASAISKSSI